MSSQLPLLKIPEGLSKRARGKNIWTVVESYYNLKVFNTEGCFHKTKIIQIFSSIFPISTAGAWRRIKEMVDHGVLRKEGDHYSLISYDRLFEKLGYDLSWNQKGRRRGSFRIIKISTKFIKAFLLYVALEELRLNLDRQRRNVKRMANRLSIPIKNLEKIHIDAKINILNDLQSLAYIDLRGKRNSKPVNNPDVTISCKGFSRLMGYVSSAAGWGLLRKMEENGLIRIVKRQILVDCNVALAKDEYEKVRQNPCYFLSRGMLYFNYTNKITLCS
jgi:hypothetical protein